MEFNLTGFNLCVYHRWIALLHNASDLDNRLDSNALNLINADLVEDNLGLAVIIAKIDEYESSVIPLSEDPPRKGNRLSSVCGAQLGAGVSSVDTGKVRGHVIS
jgi:hypothetical protein